MADVGVLQNSAEHPAQQGYQDPFKNMGFLKRLAFGLTGKENVQGIRDRSMQSYKRSALSQLAQEMQQGLGREDALHRYAGITGDFSGTLGTGQGGGVTGYVIRQMMRDDPNLSATDALARYQTGFRKGIQFDDGVASPIAGFGSALGSLGRQERFGEETGKFEAQQRLKPQVEASVATAKGTALFQQKGRQSLPLLKRSLESKELKEDFLDEKIDSLLARSGPWTTGFLGTITSISPQTPAHDFKLDIRTLLANAGFDRLQEMRDNSVSGGALGNVSNVELELLQASAQALQQSQSQAQFEHNLRAFKKQRTLSLQAVRRAYEEDVIRFGGSTSTPAPNQLDWGSLK